MRVNNFERKTFNDKYFFVFAPFKLLPLIISFLIHVNCLNAQNLEWNITLFGFADNREYKSSVQIPQTFYGTQFVPELGLKFDSLHHVRIGFNALYEFGSNKFVDKVYPHLYYYFSGQLFKFHFGSFSRHSIFRDAPDALYYDSLSYFRPYINGLHWSYNRQSFSQSVYLDWTSRQTDLRRETFIMGSQGRYNLGNFFVYNHIYMYHYAKPALPSPSTFIRDNGVAYLLIGYNAAPHSSFDSLCIGIGGIQSYERSRDINIWSTPMGFLIQALCQYKGFGIRNIFYFGQGHNLDWGDPFYRLKQYNRLDFYFTPLSFQRVKGRFEISMHFAEGKISHQQKFELLVNINSKSYLKSQKTTSY
jgi:hypothetical protein